jgi:hypothetical protein
MTTQISGTTGVNQVQDGSIVQADLGANVAGNGPAFVASRIGPQSLAATAVSYELVVSTEEYDTNSNYDPATGRFTPTIAGFYQVNGSCFVNATTVTGGGIQIRKNGVTTLSEDYFYNTAQSGAPRFSVSTLVYLNGSTDYVSLFAASVGTSAWVAALMYFSGFLARAA